MGERSPRPPRGGGRIQSAQPIRPRFRAERENEPRLKKLQENLLRKTQGVTRGYKADREDLSAGEKTQLQRLSDEQGKLSQLMKTFVSKFEEQKKAYDKKGPHDE